MKTTLKLLATAMIAAFVISSCQKDEVDTPEENDNEVITTMEVHLTEQGTANTKVFSIDYPDGYGPGITPVKQTIVLDADKVYDAEILLLDKTKNPVDTTSAEVEEENADHRFYFEPSTGANITVSNLDMDDNGVPLGLHSTWTTTSPANGTITITLRHYPNGGKAADDLVSSTKSSTDMSVQFDTEVQ